MKKCQLTVIAAKRFVFILEMLCAIWRIVLPPEESQFVAGEGIVATLHTTDAVQLIEASIGRIETQLDHLQKNRREIQFLLSDLKRLLP